MFNEHDSTPRRPGVIRRLFGFLGRAISWFRVTLTNLIFLVLLVVVIVALMPQQPVSLPDEFALRLAPNGYLVDEESYVDPISFILGGGEANDLEIPTRDLIKAIDEGREDPRVTALVLELSDFMGGGISKLEEVGAALTRFKDSGKPVVALSDLYTQDQYYLASYANDVYLDPMGSVLLTGYSSYRTYFKDALDKLAINFHVFRVGQYKDFVEPYTRNDMSPASREHNSEWLNQLWGVYTSRVEASRQLPTGAINSYIDNLDQRLIEAGGSGAQLAREAGLVDEVLSYRERHNTLTERFGYSSEGDYYNGVDYDVYLADTRRLDPSEADGKVGLVLATGTISDGEQPEGSIGSDTFLQRIQQVRDDPSIKALVVRIDSGGGSAYASEVIRSELAALRAEGMPVLISMGSMAASGGYWMAAGADEIWATPTTLTGSIGVFGAIPTFEDSLDKLGINVDGVGTTPLAGSMRLDRELSSQASRIIQQTVNNIYSQFLNLVAEARGMTPEAVDQIAQGRVWTGATAQELGLVDRLGSLRETLAAAAGHAELDEYEVKVITRPLSPVEVLMKQISEGQASALIPKNTTQHWLSADIKRQLSPLLAPFRALAEMDDNRAVYARCLECIAP
ncbi:signal peptide peptidase SppA [Marinimicrobium sp. C2-29]|uniref:signal peptide peptidase SppA n=1 Tax=Marinimicrobium sp. C2-29 TaxID=3139825 RepID=UPI00313A0A7B